MLKRRDAMPKGPRILDFSIQFGGAMEPGAHPNVAFSCWRGLASLVKARQRLYQRKVQGRASQLQRDVRPVAPGLVFVFRDCVAACAMACAVESSRGSRDAGCPGPGYVRMPDAGRDGRRLRYRRASE